MVEMAFLWSRNNKDLISIEVSGKINVFSLVFVWNISLRKKRLIFFSKWKPSKNFFTLSFSFFSFHLNFFLKSFLFFKDLLFLYVWILCLNIYGTEYIRHCMYSWYLQRSERPGSLGAEWVLGTEPMSSARTSSLDHRSISSALIRHILFTFLLCFPKLFFLWDYHISLWVLLLNVKHMFCKIRLTSCM